MRQTLVIDDHLGFQWAVARAALAGGALTLLDSAQQGGASLPSPFMGGHWQFSQGTVGFLFVLLLAGAIVPPRSVRQGAWLVLCAAVAAVAAAALAVDSPVLRPDLSPAPSWGALGAGLGLGLALAAGPMTRWQRALTVLTGTALSFGARLLPAALSGQGLMQALPGQVGVLLGGMGMGLIVSTAALVRRLRLASVARVSRKDLLPLLPAAEATDEIAVLLRQSVSTYKEAADALAEHPAALAATEELVNKIARFGKRWRDIEAQAAKSDPAELSARIAELRRRQDTTADEQARGEYEKARAALDAQLAYLLEIRAGRERAVARLHHQVATLERLRLAAVRQRSLDAARLGEDLRALIDELTRTGRDLDADAEALAEVPM